MKAMEYGDLEMESTAAGRCMRLLDQLLVARESVRARIEKIICAPMETFRRLDRDGTICNMDPDTQAALDRVRSRLDSFGRKESRALVDELTGAVQDARHALGAALDATTGGKGAPGASSHA